MTIQNNETADLLEKILIELDEAKEIAENKLRLIARTLDAPSVTAPRLYNLTRCLYDLARLDHTEFLLPDEHTIKQAGLIIRAMNTKYNISPQHIDNEHGGVVDIEWNNCLRFQVYPIDIAWPVVNVRAYGREKESSMV